MLKFQYRGSNKTVWLIGPVMKIGSAKSNEIVLAEEGIAPLHCHLHVNENRIEVEPLGDNPVYINEVLVKKKTLLGMEDVVRIGTQEFAILNPQSKAAIVPAAAPAPVSSEATVFRAPVNLDAIGEGSGWMLQALHPNLKNKRYPIDGTKSLGRSQECELHFSFDRLSRKHAELKVIDGILVVKDLDSSNGTFVNGEKVKQAKLSAGDTVAFDKLEFTVIAPSSAGKSAEGAEGLNQTMVRAALTPDMLKAAKPQSLPEQKAVGKETPVASMLMIAAGVVILLIVAAVLFLK